MGKRIMSSFLLNALLAGAGLSLLLGPIGCFVVWRRISFIGDTLSHSAIAGVALALLSNVMPFWGILGVAVFVGVFLVLVRGQKWLPDDTWLAIMAHSLLAVGLVIFALAGGGASDLQSYLFGDILIISNSSLRELYMGLFLIAGAIILIWKDLVSITISPDLAAVEGVKIKLNEIVFMLSVALLVSLSVKVVGALLLTAMMIIPAASARILSQNPTQMIFSSMLFGIAAVVSGVFGSAVFDVPTSPFIVVCAVIIFILSQVVVAFKSFLVR